MRYFLIFFLILNLPIALAITSSGTFNVDIGNDGNEYSENNGNGGSSGGNGICMPYWECTEWSECTSGVQSRVCIDKWSCDRYEDQPIQTRNCTKELEVKGEVTVDLEESKNKTTNEKIGNVIEKTVKIAKTNWEFTIFLVLVLISGLIWLYITHKKKQDKDGIQEDN